VYGGPAQSFGTVVDGQTMYVNCSNYYWDEINLTYTRFGIPIVIDIPSPATLLEIRAREQDTLRQLGYISPICPDKDDNASVGGDKHAQKKKRRQSISKLPFFGLKTSKPIQIPTTAQRPRHKSIAHKLKKMTLRTKQPVATGGAYSFRATSSSADAPRTEGPACMLGDQKNRVNRSQTLLTVPSYRPTLAASHTTETSDDA
jgi:hypothetical protein